MDYHLHRNGIDQGVFSLEELRRRRLSGEIAGSDLVWRQGMSNWEPVDSVLASSGQPIALATPPPIPASARRKSNVWLVSIIIVSGLALVAGLAGLSTLALRFNQRLQRKLQQAERGSDDSVEVASKQVPAGTNTLTEKDIRNQARDFRSRQYLQA